MKRKKFALKGILALLIVAAFTVTAFASDPQGFNWRFGDGLPDDLSELTDEEAEWWGRGGPDIVDQSPQIVLPDDLTSLSEKEIEAWGRGHLTVPSDFDNSLSREGRDSDWQANGFTHDPTLISNFDFVILDENGNEVGNSKSYNPSLPVTIPARGSIIIRPTGNNGLGWLVPNNYWLCFGYRVNNAYANIAAEYRDTANGLPGTVAVGNLGPVSGAMFGFAARVPATSYYSIQIYNLSGFSVQMTRFDYFITDNTDAALAFAKSWRPI